MCTGLLKRDTSPARVGLRLLAGFAIYVALSALWLAAGLDRAYDDLVLRLALRVAPLLTHYPLGASTVSPLAVHNQGYAVVLLVALFLVARPLGWGRRLRRYSMLLALVVASHTAALAVQLHIDLALRFERKAGVALLLPWELELLTRSFQLLFALGLQIAPFLILALTVFWTSGRSLPELFGAEPSVPAKSEPNLRRWAWISFGIAATLTGLAAWAFWHRETDPRHVEAHVFVADQFLRREQDRDAAAQYRAAIRGGTRDGRVWYNLAGILRRQGRHAEADELIDRALRVVEDPSWRRELQQDRPG